MGLSGTSIRVEDASIEGLQYAAALLSRPPNASNRSTGPVACLLLVGSPIGRQPKLVSGRRAVVEDPPPAECTAVDVGHPDDQLLDLLVIRQAQMGTGRMPKHSNTSAMFRDLMWVDHVLRK
jgi:hypothetical protein